MEDESTGETFQKEFIDNDAKRKNVIFENQTPTNFQASRCAFQEKWRGKDFNWSILQPLDMLHDVFMMVTLNPLDLKYTINLSIDLLHQQLQPL